MKKERIIQAILFFAILCITVGMVSAQTYDAKPTAHITLDNGMAVDTTLQAGEEYAGKAPMEISFNANATTSGSHLHYLWDIADNAEYANGDVAYESEFSRRFDKMGTYYIRLTITDLDTDSTTQYDSFKITLAQSKLSVPNTFTPNGDGIHDVLKVSYESLISFKAIVFNRWGKKVYAWDDPEGGWDGGDCTAGVYYIVVEAVGADGQEYHIRQAVNLLKSMSTKL